jgi:tetratricopeptide (TPR) repeat protein/peroxiredoxin
MLLARGVEKSPVPSTAAQWPVQWDVRLSPRYLKPSPLDEVLKQVDSGLDVFVTEKYASEIEEVLSTWSAGLTKYPADFAPMESCLAAGFRGSILQPTVREEKHVSSDLTVWRCGFGSTPNDAGPPPLTLDREGFSAQLRGLLYPSPRPETTSQVLIAEFKLVGISTGLASSDLETRIRYDLVQTGARFHRYERVGYWNVKWVKGQTWQVGEWQAVEENSSMTFGALFSDITERTLGANASYRDQLLHGVDHWRTVLDGASRIDVYGNNGLAAGDIDGDGFDDVYVCQPSGLPNRLYRNRGDGTFEDVTEQAGVGVLDGTACALFADLSNRGRQDLIVVSVDGPLLFVNQGSGKFEHRPDAFRFAQPPQGTFTGAAIADYDGDGFLDVYFCLYSYYQGLNQYQYPAPYYDAENGPPNFLMHNQGDGTFADVTAVSGMNVNNNRYSFTCAWADFDGDGHPDLYVVNDFGRKNLYRNNGDGTFADVACRAGVEDVGAGMSVCWFDYDNDGKQDLYVSDMWSAAGKRVTTQDMFLRGAANEIRALARKHADGNSLFHNGGSGRFTDVSIAAGVQAGRWSWQSDAWDFDHDGYPDLYVANGMISGPQRRDLSSFFWRHVVAETPLEAHSSPAYERGWNAINELIRTDGTWAGYQRNNFYVNHGDGMFSEAAGALGLDFIEDTRTFALLDFDHDGRLEVLLKNRNAPQVRVLHNDMRDLGASIMFRLRGHKSNRDAIGAAITLQSGDLKQVKFISAGGGFLSQHTKDVHFGLGTNGHPVRAEIRWPSGLVQHFDNLPAGNLILIEEGAAVFRAEPFALSAATTCAPDVTGSARMPGVEPECGSVSAIRKGPAESDPPSASVETWLLSPVAAPDFSLADSAGGQHTLRSFRGQRLLLHFWASSSPASLADLETLAHLHARWKSEGLAVASINLNSSSEAHQVRSLIREKGYPFPVLLATDQTAAVYNILYRYLFDRRRDLAIPTSFLIDSEGMIVKIYQGVLNPAVVEADVSQIPRTPAERMQKGLPFPGRLYGGEFRRNQFTYALVFHDRGYLDEALASCRLVLERAPDNAEAHYLAGMIYLEKHMPKEARASFEQTLKARPAYPGTFADAWNNLGMLAAQEDRNDDAISALKQAVRLNPKSVVALENLGNVYRRQKRWADAQSMLEGALKIDPNNAAAEYSLGMIFAQQDDTARAEQRFNAALKLRPDYPEALNNLGVLYLRTKRVESGVKEFEACIRADPSFAQPYLNLARVYQIQGRPDEAAITLHQLLAEHPDNQEAKQLLEKVGR